MPVLSAYQPRLLNTHRPRWFRPHALMRRFGAGLLGLGLAAQLGCSPAPTYTPGACDQVPYTWLDKDQVGKVLHAEELTDEAVTAENMELLAAGAGLGDLLPLRWDTRVFRIRYSTQDRGKLVEATGLVAVPTRAEGADRALPMVAALHGTTGMTGACAPSAPDNVSEQSMLVGAFGTMGYITVLPDYIGMDAAHPLGERDDPTHAYLVMEPVAVATLDMMRAVRDWVGTTGLGPTPSGVNVVVGGSQGGHAAFATERLGPHYAPELPFKAAIALVPPTDLVGLLREAAAEKSPTTDAVAPALIAMDRWYADGVNIPDILNDAPPTRLASLMMDDMDLTCDVDQHMSLVDDPAELFAAGLVENLRAGKLDELGVASCYFRENSIATSSVPRISDTPFLFVQSQNDEIVVPAVERADFVHLCEQGYQMDYIECQNAGHSQSGLWSLKEQLLWLKDRLDDKPLPATNCQLLEAIACNGEGL